MKYLEYLIKENIHNLNVQLLESKGLCSEGKLNERYIKLFVNYKTLLEKYLNSKLKIYEYDNSLKNSPFKFQVTKDEDMDVYQICSTMKLNYIYLRNYLYVEKLSNEDIEKIVSLTSADLENPSDELFSLIERTYSDVTDSNFRKDVEAMNCYGPDVNRFWHASSELVFGIRYDMFAPTEFTDEEWKENHYKQLEYINDIIKKMEEEMAEALGKKVSFIFYTDYTVNSVKNIPQAKEGNKSSLK